MTARLLFQTRLPRIESARVHVPTRYDRPVGPARNAVTLELCRSTVASTRRVRMELDSLGKLPACWSRPVRRSRVPCYRPWFRLANPTVVPLAPTGFLRTAGTVRPGPYFDIGNDEHPCPMYGCLVRFVADAGLSRCARCGGMRPPSPGAGASARVRQLHPSTPRCGQTALHWPGFVGRQMEPGHPPRQSDAIPLIRATPRSSVP